MEKPPRSPPKLISDKPKAAHCDDDFVPRLGEDISLANSIFIPGFLMLHELGPMEAFCWCDPEMIKYDDESGYAVFQHRTLRN